jgi:hypothetical protein
MPKRYRKLAILAKNDVTYGTDPVPTGAANAMVVSDVEITPLDGEEVERNNLQPYFGHFGLLQATQFNRIKFNVEMAGSGAAGTAPKYAPLLLGCSVSETVAAGVSVTYAPADTNQKSTTIYANVDGINHVLLSARGECKAGLNAKGKPVWMFDFMGLWVQLTDTALPTPVYTGWVAPVAVNKANTTATLHAIAVAMSSFELTFGNQVEKRDLTAVDSVEIVDRKSGGNIVFENTPIATKNWVETARAKTRGNLAIVHGTQAGNIITFNATGTCELGKPSYSVEQGVQMLNAPLRFVPTGAGNDEWSIVFT